MRAKKTDTFAYLIGILLSFIGHLLFAVFTIAVLEHAAATASRAPEVFSVTLEGGEVVGGIQQVPLDEKEKKKPPLAADPEAIKTPAAAKEKETNAERELTAPAVVEDPEKILAAKKAAEEQKRLEEKRKAEEEKKLRDEEAKKRTEAEKKKAEEEKKREEVEKKKRDERLRQAVSRFKTNYKGESVNAGGTGFGAARIGGIGMGGGTLASAEMIAYMNALQEHVKSGWRWIAGADKLRAAIRVQLAPNGQVLDVRIEESSGNANFDDSVIRAVRKADPVLAPPQKFLDVFSDVRIWFDSHDR